MWAVCSFNQIVYGAKLVELADESRENDKTPEELDHRIRHIAGLNNQMDFEESPLLRPIRDMYADLISWYNCNGNLPDQLQLTPLQLAVLQGNVDVAHDLLEHGADLDVQDPIAQETPLFYAINSDNIELICMLLCYGADVTIKNVHNNTPFYRALKKWRWNIISILIDYYADFNDDCMSLLEAMWNSHLAIQMIDRGADVNYVSDCGYCMLQIVMRTGCAALFKKVWRNIDVDILLQSKIPVLISYIEFQREWEYNTKQWVECLHLMLESSIAADLIYQCRVYYASLHMKKGFITRLRNIFQRYMVASEDRQNIISICLSLGAEITGTDLGVAMHLFGFKEELEMLIYATECYQTDAVHHPLLPLVIGSSDTKLPDMILRLKKYLQFENSEIITFRVEDISKVMVSCMGFVSMTPFWKLELLQACSPSSIHKAVCEFVENIEAACEFPSLLELSRNRVHSLVREGRKPQKPYQFLDAMKSLPLPRTVVDILLFKRPIYS